jgi:hypothetical protein
MGAAYYEDDCLAGSDSNHGTTSRSLIEHGTRDPIRAIPHRSRYRRSA